MELIAQHLGAVREHMAAMGLDAFIVPRADEYLGEYLPEHNERMHWISGFTGSAGTIIVLKDRAAIFVDGRYTVQVRQQVSEDLFEILHLIDEPNIEWLSKQLAEDAKVGYDPRMHSLSWQKSTLRLLRKHGIELIELVQNPIDLSWENRPEPELHEAILLDEKYTGVSSPEKRAAIGQAIADYGRVEELRPDETLDKSRLAWELVGLQGRIAPVDLSPEQLERLAGSYGPRQVVHEDGQLYYSRGDNPRVKLVPLTETVFQHEAIDWFRVRFDTDGDGRVFRITGLYRDGDRDETPRD